MLMLATELAAEAAKVATEVGGLPGAIIGTLTGVVIILVSAIVYMQRRADKVYGYRLAERDTLGASLHEASTAINNQATATRERNIVMDELAETIRESTQANLLLVERLTLQHEFLAGEHGKTATVIASIAEAMRNAVLQTSGVKQSVDGLLMGVPGMTKELRDHIEKLVNEVRAAAQTEARRRS